MHRFLCRSTPILPWKRRRSESPASSYAMKLIALFLAGASIAGAVEKLEIEKFALRQFEDGPALPASHEFLPGETIYWRFRVRGYHVNKTENDVGDPESRVKL